MNILFWGFVVFIFIVLGVFIHKVFQPLPTFKSKFRTTLSNSIELYTAYIKILEGELMALRKDVL